MKRSILQISWQDAVFFFVDIVVNLCYNVEIVGGAWKCLQKKGRMKSADLSERTVL